MNEQWQELKETIIELRDNDGTGTQQEVCKFLANLMDVIEKGASLINTDCEDVISRQAVLDICGKYNGQGYAWAIIQGNVEQLPSVTPQPKTGTWIEHSDEIGKWYECDQCYTAWGGPVNYCPNCGAKM